MAAFQFDVFHSASRIVRGRLVLEQMENRTGAPTVQWAYVEPAESTEVRARGTGNWDTTGRKLTLTESSAAQGTPAVWGTITEFCERKAKLGALFSLAIQVSGLHAAALTAAENSGTISMLLKQGAVRTRLQTVRQTVTPGRTIILPQPQPVPAPIPLPAFPVARPRDLAALATRTRGESRRAAYAFS